MSPVWNQPSLSITSAVASLEDLAVLGDLHLDAGERPPHRAELVLPGQVDAGQRDGLGEAVALQQVEAEQVEEVCDLPRQRSAARHEGVDSPAEALRQLVLDLGEDQLARQPERERRVPLPLVLRPGVNLES